VKKETGRRAVDRGQTWLWRVSSIFLGAPHVRVIYVTKTSLDAPIVAAAQLRDTDTVSASAGDPVQTETPAVRRTGAD